jgi:hypothetical protein
MLYLGLGIAGLFASMFYFVTLHTVIVLFMFNPEDHPITNWFKSIRSKRLKKLITLLPIGPMLEENDTNDASTATAGS